MVHKLDFKFENWMTRVNYLGVASTSLCVCLIGCVIGFFPFGEFFGVVEENLIWGISKITNLIQIYINTQSMILLTRNIIYVLYKK
jgi:hypothetical protein